MTLKEKAIELVNKMYNVDDNDNDDEYSMKYTHAISCALIAVDEILDILNEYWNQDCKINNTKIAYYDEVKQEIKKL